MPPGRPSASRASAPSWSARRPPTRTAGRPRWPACSSRCSTCATWPSFVDAVDRVLGSQARADVPDARMAVLVQPQLAPRFGGVLFAADPVSGRTDRFLLAAVEGGPDRLVSGLDDGWTAVLSPRGRGPRDPGRHRAAPRRARAAGPRRTWPAEASAAFGGPQDIEWAVDHDGTVWLLQSRPITTPTGRPGGPVLGTGPLAETFPEPLEHPRVRPVARPARRGPRARPAPDRDRAPRALRRSPGRARHRRLGRRRPRPPRRGAGRHKMLRSLDPRPPARRLRAAWRTGRLIAGAARARPRRHRAGRRATSPRSPASTSSRTAHCSPCSTTGARPCVPCTATRPWRGCSIPDTGEDVTAAALALAALAEARAEGVDARRRRRDPPGRPRPVAAPDRRWARTQRRPPPCRPPSTCATAPRASSRPPHRRHQRRRGRPRGACGCGPAGSRSSRPAPQPSSASGSSRVGVLPHRAAVRVLELDELRTATRTRAIPADLGDRVDPATAPPRALPGAVPAHRRRRIP